MSHDCQAAWEVGISAIVFSCAALSTLLGVPYKRFFASAPAKEAARAIAASSPSDWKIDRHDAYCPALDITVWHSNQGYAFKLWNGQGGIMSGKSPVFEGGANGECLWRAFKKLVVSNQNTAGEEKILRDKISAWFSEEFT